LDPDPYLHECSGRLQRFSFVALPYETSTITGFPKEAVTAYYAARDGMCGESRRLLTRSE